MRALAAALTGLLIFASWPAGGQDFDDLARRAESSLDSNPEEAAGLYGQALAIRPNWPEGWLYLGAARYRLGRYKEAADAFRKGLDLSPQMGTAWAFLGLVEAELQNPAQALANIGKGEDLGLGTNPQFELAVRVKAAQLLVESSAFSEAPAQLYPLAQRNENHPVVVETMGLCALAMPQKSAALSPERRAVVDLVGTAAWAAATQHPDVAADGYRQLIAKYPNEPGVHYAYGLYVMETDPVGAIAEFQKEIQINPSHWPAMIALASLQTRKGSPEMALPVLRAALKVVPAQSQWLCHAELAHAHMTLDHLDIAIAESEKAARMIPANANVHFLLAEAYRRGGRKADSQRERAEFEKLKAKQDPLAVPSLQPYGYAGKN